MQNTIPQMNASQDLIYTHPSMLQDMTKCAQSTA